MLLLLASACNIKKHVPEGKELYSGADFEIATPKALNNDKQVINALGEKAIPQPNRKFLGFIPLRLWLNLKVKEPKREKGFRHWLKYKVGEEPVYADKNQFEQSTLIMEQYLHNHGYFSSNVTYEPRVEKKREYVSYTVAVDGQYYINEIYLPDDSSEISQIVRDNKKKMELKSGKPYNVEKLSAERDRFTTFIRSEGYYNFNKEYIFYYVDTTVGNYELDVYFRIKPPTDSTTHKKYHINDITVYPSYSLNDTSSALAHDTIYKDEYRIIQPELFLKPNAIARNILIEKGMLFSQKKHNFTVNHFLDLGIFKFVNIQYETVGDDSLNTKIQLTPANTQDVTGEVTVSTTTSNFLGMGVSASYVHRNIFKGGERLSISGSVNAETQLNAKDQSFINTLEINGRIGLGFPQLLVPFGSDKVTTYFIPRTKFEISESYQQRIEFYTLNSLKFDFAYDWRRNTQIRHILTPLSVNDIMLLKTTDKFDDILRRNPTLRTSFDDVFIISMKYSFVFTETVDEPDDSYGYFRGNIDLAGNLSYLIAKAASKGTEPYKVFGRPFANYAQFDIDGRYYFKMSKNHSIATRVIAGIVIPYGNSEVTPYLKQFFIGGATSVRAYRLRTLGPGGYTPPQDQNDVFPDQTGDIKLELNAEYRFTIIKFLKAALFVDAGNVWLLKEDTLRPQADFEIGRFYQEIAIGVGAGVRLDFDFFVIRLDVAFPLRKPELPEGDRWTFDKLDFGKKEWRKDNLIWNFAIGYPF